MKPFVVAGSILSGGFGPWAPVNIPAQDEGSSWIRKADRRIPLRFHAAIGDPWTWEVAKLSAGRGSHAYSLGSTGVLKGNGRRTANGCEKCLLGRGSSDSWAGFLIRFEP